ncbi:hypothetical protein AAB988_37060 [Burkholderia contaminans]|uniref:hypothetical protein n=1 Tax=Burkholderia contaminans TaxID=488447 RepID=UPI0031187802
MSSGYEKWFREQVLRAVDEPDDESAAWISHEQVKLDTAAQRDVLEVLSASTEVSGDRWRAIRWFRNEKLSFFDGKTAEQLVLEGRRGDVLRYLRALDAGAAG